jgi:hypothetical protein
MSAAKIWHLYHSANRAECGASVSAQQTTVTPGYVTCESCRWSGDIRRRDEAALADGTHPAYALLGVS